ncbi:hypothetical protein ACFSHR_02440 [Azotobacter chroococcum]
MEGWLREGFEASDLARPLFGEGGVQDWTVCMGMGTSVILTTTNVSPMQSSSSHTHLIYKDNFW